MAVKDACDVGGDRARRRRLGDAVVQDEVGQAEQLRGGRRRGGETDHFPRQQLLNVVGDHLRRWTEGEHQPNVLFHLSYPYLTASDFTSVDFHHFLCNCNTTNCNTNQ